MSERITGTLGVIVDSLAISQLMHIVNEHGLVDARDNLNDPRVQRAMLISAFRLGWDPVNLTIGEPVMPTGSTNADLRRAISEQRQFIDELHVLKIIDEDTHSDLKLALRNRTESLKR